MSFGKPEKKNMLGKYRNAVIGVLIGVLLISCFATGFLWGKSHICKGSGGVMAKVPGVGEVCVTKFIDARDCRDGLRADEALLKAGFCRDATGLYPLIINEFEPVGLVDVGFKNNVSGV